MPVYPSMPYAPPSYYGYRGGDNISALLMRQGEIAARGAERSGDIWGHVVENLGNIAGNYVNQRNEQKQGEKRQAAFQDALSTWDPADPQGSTMRMAKAIGPDAIKFGAGMTELQAQAEKQKQGQAPDMKGLANVVGMVKVYKDVHGDEGLAQAWSNYGHILAPYANLIAPGQDISQYRPEFGKVIDSLDERMNPKASKAPERVQQNGQWFERQQDGSWKPAAGLPTATPKAEVPHTQNINGRVMQFNPQTNKFDIDLGKSEGELGREASAAAQAAARTERATTAEGKAAEKERARLEAKQANDEQVGSAFAAMERQLEEVKKYAGAAAFTSPLEAANARGQYQDAAKAFAATLSRATGDTRISDSDRKAYAKLLTYMGPGSGLLMVTRPDLVEKRLKEAKELFKAAQGAKTVAPGAFAGMGSGAMSGSGTGSDPYVYE